MTSGTYRFTVLDNTETQVQIRYDGGTATLPYNSLFHLFDDGDFNDDDTDVLPLGDGTLDGDDGEDINCLGYVQHCLDGTFSLLQPTSNPDTNVFASAYVEPEYDWAYLQGFNQTNLPFVLEMDRPDRNGSTIQAYFDQYRNSKNGSVIYERDDFWVGYIVIGYQSGINPDPRPEDGDAYLFGSLIAGGFSPADNVLVDLADDADDSLDVFKGSVGSILYIEGMGDLDKTAGPSVNNWRQRVPPHELGHQIGLRGDTSGFGIMTQGGSDIRLIPRHISVVRWRVASPGEPNF
jgi:hypothetical protein